MKSILILLFELLGKRGRKRHLNLIADVNDKSMGSRLHSDPVVVSSDLKAGDLSIGEEKGHATGVRV